jgi:hypothetical protein
MSSDPTPSPSGVVNWRRLQAAVKKARMANKAMTNRVEAMVARRGRR